MTYEDLFCDPVRSGVYRLPESAARVARAARANDFTHWRVDLATVRSKSELLASLARALEFPDWFGGNWDALQDCLGDLSWRPAPGYVIVLSHCGGFAAGAREDFESALEVFDATAEFWREQGIPFWVFIGGLDAPPYDLPGLDEVG
jgi:hypothetical protein